MKYKKKKNKSDWWFLRKCVQTNKNFFLLNKQIKKKINFIWDVSKILLRKYQWYIIHLLTNICRYLIQANVKSNLKITSILQCQRPVIAKYCIHCCMQARSRHEALLLDSLAYDKLDNKNITWFDVFIRIYILYFHWKGFHK